MAAQWDGYDVDQTTIPPSYRSSSQYGQDSRSTISRNDSVSDEDLYFWTLKVAYLAYVLQPKAIPQDTPGPSGAGSQVKRESVNTKAGDGWSAVMNIGDIFKDVGGKDSKSVKFPEKFLKALEKRIQDVVFGHDPKNRDHLIRRTMGVYYGTYTDPTWQKKFKDSRKIEEPILVFITKAVDVLKKELPGDEWKTKLIEQVGQFVCIIQETLRGMKHVAPELLARLDTYVSRISVPASTPNTQEYSNSTSSTSTAQAEPGISFNVKDMPFVVTVGSLFGVPQATLQSDVNNLRRFGAEKAAFVDLKGCIKCINNGSPYPARRDDFDSDEAYTFWRTGELTTLQQLIVVMTKLKPEVLVEESGEGQTNGRMGSISGRASIAGAVPGTVPGSADGFTFIPPSPRAYFRRLIDTCLAYDIEALANLDAGDSVALGILSRSHLELLSECAIRWRIMQPVRSIEIFEGIVSRFGVADVAMPTACVAEALIQVEKVAKSDWNYARWTILDKRTFLSTLSRVFDKMLQKLYGMFRELAEHGDQPDTEEIQMLLETLDIVNDNDIFRAALRPNEPPEDGHELPSMLAVDLPLQDLASRFHVLYEGVRVLAIHVYTERSVELPPEDIVRCLQLVEWIQGQAKLHRKYFRYPILEQVSIIAIFLEQVCPLLVQDLDEGRHVLMPATEEDVAAGRPGASVGEIMALYQGILEIQKLHDQYASHPLELRLSNWFGPYVQSWLEETDSKTLGWVDKAISVDNFEAEGIDRHSSSIVDLISSCQAAVRFIQDDLKWPDEVENAIFLTKLSRTISKSIEQYANRIEDLFMNDMFPGSQGSTEERSSAWMTRTKLLVSGEKKVEPFHFRPESCVKLNNIQAARSLLDKMYTAMDSDRVSMLASDILSQQDEGRPPRFLYTIKVVLAESLHDPDGSSRKLDPFLTLSGQHGERYFKTRTLYETNDPRWNETLDVSFTEDTWLAAYIWTRRLVDEHALIGRALIHLEEKVFGDFLPHDVWLDLDTAGRLLLRVSMEGERDDIQFYFGRAFRSLKRAETDMVRIIVDKMSPFLRQSISTQVLKNLVKPASSGGSWNIPVDVKFDKVRDNVASIWQSARGGNQQNLSMIPPVESDKPVERKGPRGLTDNEIEDAIKQVFDYFDETMGILRESLCEDAWQKVMTKIWKEILSVIEGLLIPPMSDQPTDMKPLADKEVEVVFKWLQFLTTFFHADGEGVPLEELQNAKHNEIKAIPLYYDMETDRLMEECVRSMQQQLHSAPSRKVTRSKSVYQQRNLGTIKKRKEEKKGDRDPANTEVIMRILRMRPGTREFLRGQLDMLAHIQKEQEKQARPAGISRRQGGSGGRGRARGGARGTRSSAALPALPAVPDEYQ